jgi:hypothetical protein
MRQRFAASALLRTVGLGTGKDAVNLDLVRGKPVRDKCEGRGTGIIVNVLVGNELTLDTAEDLLERVRPPRRIGKQVGAVKRLPHSRNVRRLFESGDERSALKSTQNLRTCCRSLKVIRSKFEEVVTGEKSSMTS